MFYVFIMKYEVLLVTFANLVKV